MNPLPWAKEAPDPDCKLTCFFCYNDSNGKVYSPPLSRDQLDKYPELDHPMAICHRCLEEKTKQPETYVAIMLQYVQAIRDEKARNN